MFKEIMNAYMESTGNWDNYQAGYEIHKAMYHYDEYGYYDDEDEED
jgi:hypothetical protein